MIAGLWCSIAACHKEETRDEPARAPAVAPRDEPARPVAAQMSRPAIDRAWIDTCLGAPTPIPWEPVHLAAAVAAARAALDGATDVPRIESPSYAPARQAEVAWTVASAALDAKREAAVLVDGAFAAATAVANASKRDRVLLWGALALRRPDPARAATWAAAIKDPSYQPELAAHEVVRLAHDGDGRAAVVAIAKLSPQWDLRGDVEDWHGYPRWLGSAATAACVAVAASAFASSADARPLVEAAERLTAKVTEEWRQNREVRALALAWARIGDLDRAFAAVSRMPGTERAGAIVALLDGFGDAPGVDLAHVDALARKAIAATRQAPFVLTGSAADRASLDDFIGQAVVGEVVAALARRHLARGDLRGASAAVDAIPTNLSKHHEAALQLACARKVAPGDLPADYAANLAAAAAQVGCLDVMQRVLAGARFGDRIAQNIAWPMLAAGRLDETLALVRTIAELAPGRAAGLHAGLALALAQAGRGADARAVVVAIPRQPEIIEQGVVAAAYGAVVALVAAGDLAGARALEGTLAPRLGR